MNGELKDAFSLKSIPIMIATAGFISAIVTMFINTNETVSIKWSIFLCWILATTTSILLKLLVDATKKSQVKEVNTFEKPIDSLPDGNILIIRKNDLFSHNSMVGCFWEEKDGIETIAFIGVVHHIQDKIIQIRIIKPLFEPEKYQPFSQNGMAKIIIRPVIPVDLFPNISGE